MRPALTLKHSTEQNFVEGTYIRFEVFVVNLAFQQLFFKPFDKKLNFEFPANPQIVEKTLDCTITLLSFLK